MKSVMTRLALILTFAAALAGCSNGPSDSTIGEAMQKSMPDFMEVGNVERVNGYEEGENKYVVDVTYSITFTKSLDDLISESTGLEKMQYSMLAMTMGKFEKGQVMNEQQSLTFVDTEQGWQMRD